MNSIITVCLLIWTAALFSLID